MVIVVLDFAADLMYDLSITMTQPTGTYATAEGISGFDVLCSTRAGSHGVQASSRLKMETDYNSQRTASAMGAPGATTRFAVLRTEV